MACPGNKCKGMPTNPILGRIASLQILAILTYVCGLRLALHPQN